jgi:hypothetical protein
MTQHLARCLFVLWLAGAAGCMDSCGCGAGEGVEAPSAARRAPVPPPESSGASPSPSVADAGAPAAALRGYVPLPEGQLKERVEALSKAVAWERKLGKPVAQAVLAKVLSDRVGAYAAKAAVSIDSREAGDVNIVIATREYTGPSGSLYLKISDTASAVPLRTGFRDMLLVEADEGGGFQRAEILDGALGLVAFHPRERVSRAMTLVRQRFLVESIARDTDDAAAAKDALTALRLEALRAP